MKRSRSLAFPPYIPRSPVVVRHIPTYRIGDRNRKAVSQRYHVRHGRLCPDYLCQRDGIEHAQRVCQHVPGTGIDEAIGALLVEAVSPVALEVALTVHQ